MLLPFGKLDIKIHIFCVIHRLRLRRFLSIIRVERVYPLSIHLYAERNIPGRLFAGPCRLLKSPAVLGIQAER